MVLTLNANGSFTFNPPAEATGTVVGFAYRVCDNGNPGPGVCSAYQNVTFNLTGPIVYHVKTAAAGNGNCTLTHECTLATALTLTQVVVSDSVNALRAGDPLLLLFAADGSLGAVRSIRSTEGPSPDGRWTIHLDPVPDEVALAIGLLVALVAAMQPFYFIRFLGGVCFLTGGLIMAYNMWRTIRGEAAAVSTRPQPALAA